MAGAAGAALAQGGRPCGEAGSGQGLGRPAAGVSGGAWAGGQRAGRHGQRAVAQAAWRVSRAQTYKGTCKAQAHREYEVYSAGQQEKQHVSELKTRWGGEVVDCMLVAGAAMAMVEDVGGDCKTPACACVDCTMQ